MNVIKVSDLTVSDVAEYIRLAEVTTDDTNTLGSLLEVAKAYVKKYTGVDDLDSDPDFVIVVLILVQDMWDSRTLYVDSNNVNKVVDSILSLHSVNLL